MNKVIGLKLTDKDKKLIKQIEDSGLSNSELIRKALNHYFKSVNQIQHEKYNQKVNLVNHTVNNNIQEIQEKTVNSVNHKIQISDNYELMEYLKRDNEWLKGRIEHFEHVQDHILAKADGKAKKETAISLYRM